MLALLTAVDASNQSVQTKSRAFSNQTKFRSQTRRERGRGELLGEVRENLVSMVC